MEKPDVSVVMPAYRCAGTIRQAIDSALAQDVSLELIVIDDEPGSGIAEILEEYKKICEAAFPQGSAKIIRYVRNEKNLGAAASRNRGVELAAGKYIAFLDADDWWAPGKLTAQIALLEQSGAVLCCTARELATSRGKLTGRVIPVPEEITYRRLLRHNCINCSSVLLRAEVMKQFQMEHEDSHEDYLLWLQILKKYQRACGINEPLLKYRQSSSGKSGNKLKSAAMTYTVYRYAGFGRVRSTLYFLRYALNGFWKYLKA